MQRTIDESYLRILFLPVFLSIILSTPNVPVSNPPRGASSRRCLCFPSLSPRRFRQSMLGAVKKGCLLLKQQNPHISILLELSTQRIQMLVGLNR